MKHEVQMEKAIALLQNYSGNPPLSLLLQQYFRQHKNMGSKDRKQFKQIVYAYFRMHRCFPESSLREKIYLSCCAAADQPEAFTSYWASQLNILATKKIDEVSADAPLPEFYFPCQAAISPQIAVKKFVDSHKIPPLTWIRVQQGAVEAVKKELEERGTELYYHAHSPQAIGMEASVSFSTLSSFQSGKFEVQDLSSQRCGTLMQAAPDERWWDCCAGSGGKSLLLHDQAPQIQLWVSDNRSSILDQLEDRFAKAGIRKYKVVQLDLIDDHIDFEHTFDGIIADMPCSGSGTWGRNPERMTFFQENEIEHYATLQQKMVQNIIPHLKPGGKLIYITCSVFARENEHQILFFEKNYPLRTLSTNYFEGAAYRSDTLFAAVLEKQ